MPTNLNNNKFRKIKTHLLLDEYYDFYISNSERDYFEYNNINECNYVNVNFNNENSIINENAFISTKNWNGSTSSDLSLKTAGLTIYDNGFQVLNFSGMTPEEKSDYIEDSLLQTNLILLENDKNLIFNTVSGSTQQYIYPTELITEGDTTYLRLCGGFLQSFYKLHQYDFQLLPNRYNKGWVFDISLRKGDYCNYSGTTLNDIYPNNKGIFFYLGTRAENKFWKPFDGLNTECTSGCTQPIGCQDEITPLCTSLKEPEIFLTDDDGLKYSLVPPIIEYREITNNFLIYGNAGKVRSRCYSTPSGLGNKDVCNFSGGSIIVSGITTFDAANNNPFLIYGNAGKVRSRCYSTPSGLGNKDVCNYERNEPVMELDYIKDIVNNALGFIIKDDGSIGYRLLTDDCDTKYKIVEKYSKPNIIQEDIFHRISVRWSAYEYYDDYELKCKGKRNGKLMIYVDGLLKFVDKDFMEFIPYALNENRLKQIGVPYNISVGGGTQGLIEAITFDGQDPNDLGLPIEQNFAGSFIGDIQYFNLYGCDLNWCEIKTI